MIVEERWMAKALDADALGGQFGVQEQRRNVVHEFRTALYALAKEVRARRERRAIARQLRISHDWCPEFGRTAKCTSSISPKPNGPFPLRARRT